MIIFKNKHYLSLTREGSDKKNCDTNPVGGGVKKGK